MGRSSGKKLLSKKSAAPRSIKPPAPTKSGIEIIIEKLKTTDPVPPGELKVVFSPPLLKKKISMKKSGQVIGLCGAPQAGKDVIAEYIEANYDQVAKANFSDYILVEVNNYLRQEGVGHEITLANKNEPLYRSLLQEWGSGRFKEDADYWPRMVASEVEKLAAKNELVLVTGLRSPADFKVVEEALGGEVWRAVRPGNSYRAEHEIEQLAATRPVDREILNPEEGDLAPFTENIEETLDFYRAP